MNIIKSVFFLALTFYILSIFTGCAQKAAHEKNIVILIGDGMGFEQIKAAEYYNGTPFMLKYKSIYSDSITTINYSGEITDSAAGATAMTTGQKVANGVLSRRIPGDYTDLETVFERAKLKSFSTGLITTSSIIDATPAAFISHSNSRTDYARISGYYMSFKPELVIGGLTFMTTADFFNMDYSIYNSIGEYNRPLNNTKIFVKISDGSAPYEYDTFIASGSQPHNLLRAVLIAEDYFHNLNTFILMIEGGRIDHAGHSGSLSNNIYETNEFFACAESIHNWLIQRGNYLMIITADHETGGLNVLKDNGAGIFPDVEWTSPAIDGKFSHTARPVPVFVYSDLLTADDLNYFKDNTDAYKIIIDFINY